MSTARIIFTGGGTGGHLFPAIAIADRLSELMKGKREVEIIFVGTRRGLEYRMREKLGYPLHTINMRGIIRGITLVNLLVPFVIATALMKSVSLLSRFQPDIVIGTGGYVCWPVLKVAAWKNIPTLLQEQNSYPGVATRQLASAAKKIYLGFEKAKEYLKTSAEIMVTGNPVRASITSGRREAALETYGLLPERRTILVLGGSQGARAINNAVLRSLEKEKLNQGVQLLWQTGSRDHKEVEIMAAKKVSNCALFPFAQQMEQVYAAADLVIARAGALSLAEITACGLPAILIPYPHAAGDHQKKNAENYVSRGMARMIEEMDLENIDIIAEAVDLLESDEYSRMKTAIARETAGQRPAVDIIAEDIIRQIEGMKTTGDRE
ncbi:MAG: undecaprenyldiphospho-muramoylpentapeptide beta-N-acetylglucosaminyltransferase [Candidatus Zixiibacteriota bacterium]|nr:MAG: undecaprenyldiphospho-muramoylpentapeptide beta-N-acetylglucosaminyltransferase [candidate division Zixibacteria bacterium]